MHVVGYKKTFTTYPYINFWGIIFSAFK
jgi:hypothetical protein